jgi:hypothetical protein
LAPRSNKTPKFGAGRGGSKTPNGRFPRLFDDDDEKKVENSEMTKSSYSSVFAKIRNGNSRFYDDDFLLRKPRRADDDADDSFLSRIGKSAETANLPCYKKFLAPKLTSWCQHNKFFFVAGGGRMK